MNRGLDWHKGRESGDGTVSQVVPGRRMVLRRRLVVVFAASLLSLPVSSAASAEARRLSSPDGVDKGEAVRFMESVIDSLLWAKRASARVRPDDSGDRLLVALRHRRQDYQCAAKRLEPLAQSDDPIIGLAAATLAEYYGPLNDLNEDSISWAAHASSIESDGLIKQLASLKSLKDAAEVSFVGVVARTPYALVQWGPQGRATGRLNVTSAERQQLLRLLTRSFGARVCSPNPGTMDAWEAAGHMIYRVLSDKRWSSVDAVLAHPTIAERLGPSESR